LLVVEADLSAMTEVAAKRYFKIEASLFGLLHETGGMRPLPVISVSRPVSQDRLRDCGSARYVPGKEPKKKLVGTLNFGLTARVKRTLEYVGRYRQVDGLSRPALVDAGRAF